jgi:hypothetical protein
MATDDLHSFGVFKPVGHVVISFPRAEQADAAHQALQQAGLATGRVMRYTDREMLEHIDEDLANASPLAGVGQELNLVRAHRELAARGYHWLVVHAPDDAQARRVAEAVRPHGAERAQSYGRFVVEELLERPGGLPQVAESPDRGLDAQTPSGEEAEAASLKAREEGRRGGRPPGQ